MNTLDSRTLSVGNCYAHRFSKPGIFRYELSLLPMSLAAHHDEEAINELTVDAATDDDQLQHNITISQIEGTVVADPAQLHARAGDLIVWSADKTVQLGFRVRGQLGDETIDSAAMSDESIFTHAFGLAGKYEWVDANGSNLHGEVEVTMPESFGNDPTEWLSSLEKGKLVHVQGDRATPEKVHVVVGQTVVWAVENAPGITVTDSRFVLD